MVGANIEQPPTFPATAPTSRRSTKSQLIAIEELRVMVKCSLDTIITFFPVSAALGALAFYGVEYGYLRPHPRLKSTPKVLAASLLGYSFASLTSHSKCEDRFLRIPYSSIGARIRETRERYSGQVLWNPPAAGDLYRPYPEILSEVSKGQLQTEIHALREEPPSAMNTDDYRSNLDLDEDSLTSGTEIPATTTSFPTKNLRRATTYQELRMEFRAAKTMVPLKERKSKAQIKTKESADIVA